MTTLAPHRDSLVQDLTVTYLGVERVATYFVENGMIHVQTGEKTILLPVGTDHPAQAVTQLLTSIIQSSVLQDTSEDPVPDGTPQPKDVG